MKYHANGVKADSPVTVKITATHSSDPSIVVFEILNILPPLDHFQVSMIPDTVKHSNQSVIMVKAKDKDNNDIDLSASAFVSFALDTAGVVYGEFQYNENKAKMFNSIPYPDAATGKIKYLADGKNPLNLYPRLINIPVTSMQDVLVSGIGEGWVQAFVNVEKKYNQVGEDYSGDNYGNSKDSTIQQLGCALCCMAMVMTAYGDSVDPGKLNEWMKDQKRNGHNDKGGFTGNKVSWYAINKHSPGKINMKPKKKKQYTTDSTTTKKELDMSQTSDQSVLNEPLLKGQLIIVQVYNSRTNGTHYVIVTEKEGNRYKIIDPGYRDLEYLDQYGEFWSYFIVSKEN